MGEQKKFRNSIARTNGEGGFDMTCPYKDCGHRIRKQTMSPGEIIGCGNCRKKIKVEKVY